MMRITRSFLLIGAVLASVILFEGCERRNEAEPPARQEQPLFEGTIVAVGDSLTAGLGVGEGDAYPVQLERKLREAGYPWRVINAGISGETSSGALSRVEWVLKLRPDIVILETGANDGLRGIDPGVMKRNLDEMVRILNRNRVTVVLAGMRMVANLGQAYTEAFSAVYPSVARKHGIILIPFFLEGVAGDPALNQADGIHPTSEGYRIVVKTVYPYVLRAIDRKKREKTGH